jgi:hypothetical protein
MKSFLEMFSKIFAFSKSQRAHSPSGVFIRGTSAIGLLKYFVVFHSEYSVLLVAVTSDTNLLIEACLIFLISLDTS